MTQEPTLTPFTSSPQPNAQPRPSRAAALAGVGVSSVGSLAASVAGAPWGVVLAVALSGLFIVLVQSVIQGMIPQDSGDRLTWWQAYWEHRRQRAQGSAPPEQRPPA
ncbi:hypothetical protein [Streptomyces olivochromogenes]|uniref:hypothetical protein n=1 Tax=Streptomyces olivochromogenes TaxID=1963 RepID=UPI001F188703|nr:hypothetical protein [Streptomyces olivochromogenes]MCF3136909.1 hypothetical protein [Streptomyces olivochromogenes]